MNRLIIILCLALGSFGVGWSGDFQKGLEAYYKGDYATALKEWKPLAEEGYIYAQYNLGIMYDNGLGVPQDYKESAKWYRLAAEQGYSSAQHNIAYMYYNGQGVKIDKIYAYMWASIASSNGFENSKVILEALSKEMTPSQIEKAQDLARECVKKSYKGC